MKSLVGAIFTPVNLFLLCSIMSMVIIGIPGFEYLRIYLYLLVVFGFSIPYAYKIKINIPNVFILIFAVYPLLQYLVVQGNILATVQAVVLIMAIFTVSNFVIRQTTIDKKQLDTFATLLAIGMFTFYYDTYPDWNFRHSGVFGNPNSTAYMTLTMLPIVWMFSNLKKIKIITLINVFILVIYTSSRGALMALCLGLGAYYIVKKRNYQFKGILLVSIGALLVSLYAVDLAMYLLGQYLEHNQIYLGERAFSLDMNGRDRIYEIAYERFFSSNTQFFGLGFDQAKFDIGAGNAHKASTHNSYLEILIRLGYMGLTMFATYLVILGKRISKIKNKKYRALIVMQLVILLSLATNNSMFLVLTFYFFYLIIILEIGLKLDIEEVIANNNYKIKKKLTHL